MILATRESRTVRFLRIQVTMSHYQSLGIAFKQLIQQFPQRHFLSLRPGVARRLAIPCQSAHVCHTNGVTVMMPAVSTYSRLRSSHLHTSVHRNDIMITTSLPSHRAMPAVYIRHAKGTARPVGGAVHDNQSDLTHTFRTIVRQRHPLHLSAPVQSPESHRAQCSSILSSYL